MRHFTLTAAPHSRPSLAPACGRARALQMVLAVGASLCGALVQALTLDAPNVVPIDARLTTSGQPTAAALAHLGELGFEAVVYLAPSTVSDAIAEEPALVRRQGLEFVHIPIPFGAPTAAHFEQLAATLERLQGKKVLVHCQVNMRASSMVFLYRTTIRHEAPATAYEAVTRVWAPQGPWRQLIEEVLRQRGVKFELY